MKSGVAKLFLRSTAHRALLNFGMELVPFGDKVSHLLEIRGSLARGGLLLNGCEAYQLMEVVAGTPKIPGDLAEVGVYRGGSARLICDVKGTRDLHLFDTFDGLPSPTSPDSGTSFSEKEFLSQMEAVREYLSGYSGMFLYAGIFPETAESIAGRKFAFVHLDVDLYESTRASLVWFYPRMSRGGVLMCHDYYCAGVRKAVDEFFTGKPETVIPQPAGAHCLTVKL